MSTSIKEQNETTKTTTTLNKLSLNHINTPTLPPNKPITPFHTHGSRSSARTTAIFYTQCHLNGIPSQDADTAILNSNKAYYDWWKQERFAKDQKSEDELKKSLWRKKRRFHEIHHKLPQGKKNDCTTVSDQSDNNDLKVVSEEEECTSEEEKSEDEDDTTASINENIEQIKSSFLQTLLSSNGDATTPELQSYISLLSSHKSNSSSITGNWVSLSKPNYPECLGTNSSGEFMYTLGRMSFDMFAPSDLKCSIQGIFNVFGDEESGAELRIPWNIIRFGGCTDKIRSYNISVSFTIEAPSGNLLRALLINHGYIAPDPHIPHRYSMWFTHGILEEDTESTTPSQEWRNTFTRPKQRNISEKARVLAAQILLGATVPEGLSENGTMEYSFKRPIGGYNDVLFSDESLQILRGQHDSMYVLHRI